MKRIAIAAGALAFAAGAMVPLTLPATADPAPVPETFTVEPGGCGYVKDAQGNDRVSSFLFLRVNWLEQEFTVENSDGTRYGTWTGQINIGKPAEPGEQVVLLTVGGDVVAERTVDVPACASSPAPTPTPTSTAEPTPTSTAEPTPTPTMTAPSGPPSSSASAAPSQQAPSPSQSTTRPAPEANGGLAKTGN